MIGYKALHEAAGLVDRGPRGAVVVWGPDAREFLQSIVSQDISVLEDCHGAHSLLLQPTGKLDVEFRILAVGKGDGRQYWLDTESGWGAQLATSLQRFLIRVDAEVADRDDDWSMVSLRGPTSVAVVEQAGLLKVPMAAHGHTAWGDIRIIRADWPGLRGVDLLGPASAVAGAVPRLVDHGAVPTTVENLETVRIECGVPRLGTELDDRVIPQEAFLDRVAVSFDKGCFLGQELVCRINDRGHVNRYLRRLRLRRDDGAASTNVPPPGAEVLHAGAPAGSVTSAAQSPDRGTIVALGYVRREVEPGDEVAVRWEGGEAAAVVEEVVLAG